MRDTDKLGMECSPRVGGNHEADIDRPRKFDLLDREDCC